MNGLPFIYEKKRPGLTPVFNLGNNPLTLLNPKQLYKIEYGGVHLLW